MTEAVSAPALKQKVAFVVDDERTIARTLAIILNHAGFDAHPFFSGQEAVDSLDKLQPDLLITDVMMPGLNGIETAIIFLTKLPKCRSFCSQGRPLLRTCWPKRVWKVTNSRFWPSLSIPTICSKRSAANLKAA